MTWSSVALVFLGDFASVKFKGLNFKLGLPAMVVCASSSLFVRVLSDSSYVPYVVNPYGVVLFGIIKLILNVGHGHVE